jgi:hypothetical protein
MLKPTPTLAPGQRNIATALRRNARDATRPWPSLASPADETTLC